MAPKWTKDAPMTLQSSRRTRKTNDESNEDGAVFGQLLDGLNQQRANRQELRKQLDEDYKERLSAVRRELHQLHEDHEAEMKRYRTKQLQQLVKLLQTKADIEAKMRDSALLLEQAYEARSKELRVILQARAEDLESLAVREGEK